jgi:hypothetical protein
MSILIDKNTKILTPDFTGKTGKAHLGDSGIGA